MSRDEDSWLDEIEIDDDDLPAAEPGGPGAHTPEPKRQRQPAGAEELADGPAIWLRSGKPACPKESLKTLTDWERYWCPRCARSRFWASSR